MAQLDISQAAFSGFGVIRRGWFAPVIWGVVLTVLAFLPVLLMLPTLIELFGAVAGSMGQGAEPDEAQIMNLSRQMNIVQPLSWITQLLSQGLITGAIFRAVLHPDQKSWFYMRVGMGEVMLVAVSLVFSIIFFVAILIAALLVAIVGFSVGVASPEAGITAAVLVGLVALGVLIWGGLRFSLGFAMSHERKQFLLFESWKMTAGNAGGLFGTAVISIVIGLLISMAVSLAFLALGALLLFSNGGFEALRTLDDSKDFASFFTPERVQGLLGVGAVYLLIASALQGYVAAIFTAPWAEAYRQLALPNEEVF